MGLVILISIMFSLYWAFTDHDYADCVFSHIEDANSDWAARIVKSACKDKFPEPNWDKLSTTPPKSGKITFDEIRSIPAYAKMSDDEILAYAKKNGLENTLDRFSALDNYVPNTKQNVFRWFVDSDVSNTNQK